MSSLVIHLLHFKAVNGPSDVSSHQISVLIFRDCLEIVYIRGCCLEVIKHGMDVMKLN